MKTRSIFALCLAMLFPAFTFAAELVAKFSSLESGATSGAFTVGENGRTITSDASWLVADGVTVVVDYSGLSLTGTQAIVTLAQSNDSSNLSKVGICSEDGILRGIWQSSAWTGGENTGHKLSESGCLVFVYYPDANTRGVFVYDSEGTEIFRAKGLKSTGNTVTTGSRFDIGATAAGELSQEGFTVNSVGIYEGYIEETSVDELIKAYNAKILEGTRKYGYDFNGSSFTKEEAATSSLTAAKPATIIASQVNGVLQLGVDAGSHYGSNFSSGTGDWSIAVVAKATGEGEVIYAMGGQRGATGLIGLRNAGDNTIEAFTANATKVTSITLESDPVDTYHLYTVVYSNGKLTMNVDGGEFTEGVDFTTGTAGQWQFGGIHGGVGNLTGVDNATSGLMDEFRVYTIALTKAQTYGLAKELGVLGERPTAEVIKENDSWTIDTTKASYALLSAEINELKTSAITVTLKSESEYGATIDLGTTTTSQKSHYVIESGEHTMKWAAGNLSNGSLDFDTTGTDANPSILVKNGATLNFYAKDMTGWNHDAKDAKTSVIKVESGATLKLYKNGNNTWFFQGRFVIEPGATVEAVDFDANKFCLNGGIYNDYQELYVPASIGTESTVTYKSNVGFKLAKDETTGYGIFVGEGSTLTLDGALSSDGARDLGKFGNGMLEITGSLSGFSGAVKIAAGSVKVKASSGLASERVVQFEVDDTREIKVTESGEWVVYTNEPKIQFDPENDAVAKTPVLRFSEIMPKPSDKPNSITTQAGYDKNGLESGWVELENTSDMWVDLGDYKFCRANRGKVYTHADYGNFPSGTYIPPHGRYTFYTSERYANSYPEAKDGNTSAFQHGTFDGKPVYYPEYNMLVWGDKVNPKKFPYVTLVYRPAEAAADTILETVIIPSDTPEGYSIIVGHDEADNEATARWLCPSPTKNAANIDTSKLTKIGPNVGPAYGTKHSATEFGPTVPAKLGEPYTVTMNVNPIYNAAGTRAADTITAVTLVYRRDLDNSTIASTPMTKTGTDEGGDVWTGTIPAEHIPAEPGHLLQWKTEITDAAENTWTSPSFMNKDDGYEWFGTITDPGELNSAKLPTWHMFADELSLKWMDTDADAQSKSEIPNQARVAIYDASTSTYHDYVRIDLRGNTSSKFIKKSHGLRFSKVNPLTTKDVVTGTDVKEIRKSSLISEFGDPSYVRQMTAFWLLNKVGSPAPFDFPVRCNLNGEFYQLAFHSERFTDELIEDVHGLDKYGYGYKNVGTLKSAGTTSAGSIEKKTPDDGNENDTSVLEKELRLPLKEAGIDENFNSMEDIERPKVTKFVVEKFNLPSWINYLAATRITQETDDVWANISIYYDSAEMKEEDAYRGTGTWMPLAYDMNQSFGQWHYGDINGARTGLMAKDDWHKSHPLYGGNVVRCYKSSGMASSSLCNEGNRAIEAVWQSPKFRRLYLRRLRTLMDQELGEPNEEATAETDTSEIMVFIRKMAELMAADAAEDRNTWGALGNTAERASAINVWPSEKWNMTQAEGIQDLYDNYIVPRREHLYKTHATEGHTAEEIGYGMSLCAGIPAAQSSLEALKEGLLAEAVDGGIVIRNKNAEAIDLSGWQVSGPVVMTLPAGTVIDQADDEGKPGEVFVVTDRVAYITANESALTDEVIIGNATAGSGTDIGLTAADGTIVLSADVILPPGEYNEASYDVPVRLAPAGEFTFKGVKFNGGLYLGEGSYTLKNQNGFVNSASVVEAPTANITFSGKGTFQLLGAKESGALMTVKDLIVSNGVFSVESKATTSETCAVVVNGGFAVEDKGTVNLKLTKNAAQGRGFFIANKDMFCRIGKGGTFTAELNGPGCRAIQGDKGSVNLEIHDGATVTATGTAADARYFKMKGNIKISGGKVNLTATGSGTELLSCDKAVTISGGTLTLTSTDDCVSAATAINVSGGTIIGSSSANDVLDSNGTISISGGTLVLLSTAEGHEGLDCDPSTPDEKTHTITISGGVVYSLGGKDCDLHIPEAEGQIYTVLNTSTDEGYVIVSDGTNNHIFVKPTNGRKALISIPNMTGDAEEVSVSTEEATPVVEGKYWTILLPSAPATWEEVEVTEDTTVAELVGADQGTVLEALKVEPAKIVAWAKTHSSSTKPGEPIDNLVAFALNCAPNEEAIAAANKNFKVTITMTAEGPVAEIESGNYNITPVLKGKAELADEKWTTIKPDASNRDGFKFFKAFIDIEQN